MRKNISAIVVDDDPDMVDIITELLDLKGVNVIAKGYDGNDAVAAYKILKPDIVFLDLMMDNYDGFFALENIRKDNPNAKVVIITADIRKETNEKLTKLNPTKVFHKPLEIDQIVNLLETFDDFKES